MKIYFSEIAFQDTPLVWELNEKTGEAICLFYCLNESPKPVAQTYITGLLEKIPGIQIIDNLPVIKDIDLFDKRYTPVETEPTSSMHSTKLIVSRKNSTFFKPKDVSSTGTKSRLSSSCSPTYEHIDLDSVIPNDEVNSPQWGETIAFEKHFQEKNSKDAKTYSALFVKSAMTFNALAQCEINEHINPIKCQLITSIRTLLNLLDPVYVAWCAQQKESVTPDTLSLGTNEKKLLFTYLQNAVLDAMLNGRCNKKPTEFEEMDSSNLNPALLKHMEYQARALRAELMLMKFLVLINEHLSIELAVNEIEDKTLLLIVQSLRKFLLEQPIKTQREINLKLEEISSLIIQGGIVELANEKLHQKLSQDLIDKSHPIYNCFSFSSRLLMILNSSDCLKGKQHLLLSIIQQATTTTIQKIEVAFSDKQFRSHIAPLYASRDQDFYLCTDWTEKLIPELRQLTLKHPKDERKVAQYCAAVAEAVIHFIDGQLKELMNNQSQPSPSTISI